KISAFLPPHRPLDRSERPAHAVGDGVDWLGSGDDFFQRRIELLDALGRLLRRRAADAGHRKTACRGGYRQHLPARNVVMNGHEVSCDADCSLPRLPGRAREGANSTAQTRVEGPLPNPPPQAREGERSSAARGYAFFATGTGVPAILTLTEPSVVRLVKN